MRRRKILLSALVAFSMPVLAEKNNFTNRKEVIINNCPFIELSDFSFVNNYDERITRFEQYLRWRNIGKQALIAFEIVIIKYDAFDQRMTGSRWTVTGHDSANWEPLQPGEIAGDGTRGLGVEEVMTAIAYVRAARLEDGTVWRANDVELLQKVKQVTNGIKDFGSFKPDSKPSLETK